MIRRLYSTAMQWLFAWQLAYKGVRLTVEDPEPEREREPIRYAGSHRATNDSEDNTDQLWEAYRDIKYAHREQDADD